ncbi:beta-lactamase family protein [Luteimonas sp. MC1782]|nr:beta-lactamase family protein [Luteimonas sp. MC1895]
MRLPTAVLLLAVALPWAPATGRDAMTEADARLQRYTGEVPGAALLVLRDGEPVLRRSVGLADVDAGTPVTPATNFRLASVSKQFTAAAVLLLAEDGRLRLDDPVRRWLPELPASADGVTLHHLLSHTSGLHDYEDLMAADFHGQVRDAGVVGLLASGGEPYFAPGSAYRYSNSAYALLALVVEQASGKPYQDVLRERIFVPLGMTHSVAFVDGLNTVDARAYGHSADGGGWRRTDQSTTSAVLGDGGIYSSIDDLARWDAALADDRLLSEASRALAFSPQTTTPTGEADVAAYGYGWRLDGQGLLWHSGETIGFRNVILRWPAQRLTVVMLTNRNAPEPYADARAIGEAFLREATAR